MSGHADLDQDGKLKSKELYTFVTNQVDKQSQGAQIPRWSGAQFNTPVIHTMPSTQSTKTNSVINQRSGVRNATNPNLTNPNPSSHVGPPTKHTASGPHNTLDLPVIRSNIYIPTIPSYLMKKPSSGPSAITWSLLGSTAVSVGVSAYLVDQTNQKAQAVKGNLQSTSSYEIDQMNRTRYDKSRTKSYVALGVSSGLALASLGLWTYEYMSQRQSKKSTWFSIKPVDNSITVTDKE